MKSYFLNFLIPIIVFTQFSFAQNQNEYGPDLQHCVLLDTYLMKKDVTNLNSILHPNLSLGHSNGWIETKESLLENLPTSKIKYHAFLYHGTPEVHFQNEEIKSIRRNLTAKGNLIEQEFEVDLKILEVWILVNENWQLLSRQSVEVDFDS